MQVTITSERYYAADAPILTKKMLDWLFLTMWSTRMHHHNIKSIDTIDIRVNTAYNGSSRIHFYIKVNNEHEFHKVFTQGAKLYHQNPSVGSSHEKREFNLSFAGKAKRRDWILYLIDNNIDINDDELRDKALRRRELQKEWRTKRDDIKKANAQEKAEHSTYLRLKDTFEPEESPQSLIWMIDGVEYSWMGTYLFSDDKKKWHEAVLIGYSDKRINKFVIQQDNISGIGLAQHIKPLE